MHTRTRTPSDCSSIQHCLFHFSLLGISAGSSLVVKMATVWLAIPPPVTADPSWSDLDNDDDDEDAKVKEAAQLEANRLRWINRRQRRDELLRCRTRFQEQLEKLKELPRRGLKKREKAMLRAERILGDSMAFIFFWMSVEGIGGGWPLSARRISRMLNDPEVVRFGLWELQFLF